MRKVMSSKIFEEAIADAKKLKEVAEDNAKKAILEAVTPRIREFIEDQLLESDVEEASEEEDDREDKDLDEEVVLDEASIKSLVNMLGGDKIISSLNEGVALKASISEAMVNLNSQERSRLLSLAEKINENADNLANNKINSNISNQENEKMNREKFYEVDLASLREAVEAEMAGMEEEMYEEEEMEAETADMDLEAMLQEIALRIDLGEDIEEDMLPDELLGMLIDDEEEEGEEAELGAEEGEEAAEEELGDEEAEDLAGALMGDEEGEEAMNEVFDIDPRMLRQEIARMKRLMREGKMDHHFGGKGSSAGVGGSFGGKGPKNLGKSKAFGGGAEGQDVFTNPPQMNKLNEAIRNLRRQNRSQQIQLNKYRSAVKTLREQLEDLNLFNAKLLYVNKLLQNKSLNESQKKSVIKALDEARSLGETKALYKSLTESLSNSSKTTLSESRKFGSSSRPTSSASAKNTEVISEVNRWQTLAGLK
jgi:hypothetical protein